MIGEPTVILRSFNMEARGVKEMAQQVRSAPNTIMRTGGQIPVHKWSIPNTLVWTPAPRSARDRRIPRVV